MLFILWHFAHVNSWEKSRHIFPFCGGRRAQDRAEDFELVHTILAWKQRLHKKEFCHDATNSEYVNLESVTSGSKNTFGCPIPSGLNVLCVRWPRIHFSTKSKVGNLDLSCVNGDSVRFLSLNEYVIGLDVSVKKPSFMNVSQPSQNTEHYELDLFLFEHL